MGNGLQTVAGSTTDAIRTYSRPKFQQQSGPYDSEYSCMMIWTLNIISGWQCNFYPSPWRLERCNKMLRCFRNHGSIVKLFSDERIFLIDTVWDYWNDQFLVESTAQVKFIFRSKHPVQSLVSWLLTAHFFSRQDFPLPRENLYNKVVKYDWQIMQILVPIKNLCST